MVATSSLLLLLAATTATLPMALAFAPVARHTTTTTTRLDAWPQDLGKALATTVLVTASLWSLPPSPISSDNVGTTQSTTSVINTKNIFSVQSAAAKEMASGTGSRVNKDPESLLRLALPINNKEVRKLQTVLESIRIDISTKRKSAAIDSAKKAKNIMTNKDASKMVATCQQSNVCSDVLSSMIQDIDPLVAALKESQDSFQGSEQERKALDKAYTAQKNLVDQLTVLEEQMIPANYETPVPQIYSDLPQLKGRATVEMIARKADPGDTFDVQGTTFKEAKLVMIIDGYTAPVTGGNFVDLVNKKFYNNMKIQRSDGFVVQTGEPDGDAIGYVAPGSKSIGQGKKGERLIPLETFVKGDAGPFYEITIEDEGRGGQATVLPFSSYGAMGWARDEYDPNSGSSQFFWLLFDSDLTPAGKNVLDGRYPCFGYVVEGADFLADLKEGDIIVSAKITKGLEKLVSGKSN